MADPSNASVATAVVTAEEAQGLDPVFARSLVARIDQRRLALQGDQSMLRARFDEVMQWVNPPWNPDSKRLDPRPERVSALGQGRSILHTDQAGQTVNRWASLEAGSAPSFRVQPTYTAAPIPDEDPIAQAKARLLYDKDRAIAQNQASQMESQTKDWMEAIYFHRTLLWASWAKNAFGVAILKDGWDPIEGIPTCELYENPSQVYRGWTRRYGNRKLGWVAVVDEMSPEEANQRFDLDIPTLNGFVDYGNWSTTLDYGDMDLRPEQQNANEQFVRAIEYWELHREIGSDGLGRTYVMRADVVANRIVAIGAWPWRRLPFHVLENEHISTWQHSKSTAEAAIPLNEAWDDMLDRQAAVIEFESGPRYMGLNMWASGDDIDVPGPFELLPLRDGEEIRQLDTRVDFFPSQLHGNELREAGYRSTGLTPIAWGLSPRAQTSGRALSTEWRAVELPLAGRLINMTPELVDIVKNWWDYAESYDGDFKAVGKGYRRFKFIWEPLDVRDSTEKTLEVIQKLTANIIDPELAMELTGIDNVDEVMARVKSYLLDPVYNPLRYQQYLILRQLGVSIQMQELQLNQMQQQAGVQPTQSGPPGSTPAGPPPEALANQGAQASAQNAQGPGGPATSAQNQPGQLPVAASILSQTPLQGGIGNRVIVQPGGQTPTTGQAPQ